MGLLSGHGPRQRVGLHGGWRVGGGGSVADGAASGDTDGDGGDGDGGEVSPPRLT